MNLTPKPTRLLIPLFFFLSSLIFLASSVSSTLSYYDFGSKSKHQLQQCFDKCTQDVQQIAQQLVCQKACLLRDLKNYKEEEEEEEEEEGGGQPFPQSSSQEEYQQCQQWCREEEYDYPRQLKKCQQRCDEKLSKREAEEEQEEEGGGRGGKTRPEPEPEKKLRHCQRRCVRRYGTGQERQICKRTCRKQYDREKGYEGPPDLIDINLEEVPTGKQYEHCRKSCQRQSQDQRQQKKCESQCQQKQSPQKELQSEEEEEEESWESNSIINYNKDVPRVKYQKCQRKCDKHKSSHESPEMKIKCQQRCEKEYGGSDDKQREKGKQEKEHQQGQEQRLKRKEAEKEHQEQGQKGSESREEGENKGEEEKNPTGSETEERIHEILRNNPYYFPSDESRSRFRTREGQLKVFDMFSEKSNVLQGIENYRFAVLEAGPNTFVIPHHHDAESVLVVVRGKGKISLVSQKRRNSYNIEFGDVIRVPAGTTVYLINQQNDDNLEIAKLFQPVNNPGQFKEYFVAGGQHPQSYYRAFSTHLLYQVLNVPREQVDRFFGQENQGKWQGQRQAIAIKASQEQLKALSQQEYSSSEQIINSNSKGPIRLRNKKPVYSNEFGKILEANPDEHRQLRDFDVFVHLIEINKGAIMVPHYNSRSTVVGLVLEGSGHFEMVCPHFSSHGGDDDDDDDNGKKNNQLQVNRAIFSPGDVFVVPADHPISFIPDPNQNLTILEFGINGLNNQRNFIAGKDSIVMKMEREANKLAFNVEGEELEQIFSSQKLSYFVPKLEIEQEEQQGGNQHHRFFVPILDFAAGLF